jgi:TonB family protein
LLLGASFAGAQEAPRPEGSSPIKPPMIKPPMNRAQNANSGGGSSSSRRRRKTTRRKRRARKATTAREEFIAVSIEPQPGDSTEAGAAAPRKRARTSRPISGGVLNGKAKSLPQPEYPAIARSTRASGTVVVQVVIDEQGNVISADAVSGHKLFREAAVEAARQARFTPTLLSGQPVQVTGVITYDFVP